MVAAGSNALKAGGTAQAAAQYPFSQSEVAAKYSTLVMRVYFSTVAQRDQLAQELSAEEVPTTGGYVTVLGDQAMYNNLLARGLRVEIDEKQSRELSDPQYIHDTFYGGYKTVEEIYAYLDQEVAAHPNLAEKQDIGDFWWKTHAGSCTYPSANNGYDLFVLHIHQPLEYQGRSPPCGRTGASTPVRSPRLKSQCAS